jgi:hypothetical protein
MPSTGNTSLSDEQKELIRQEEIYREEVRKELTEPEKKPSRREKFWSVMNRPFSLWLCSFVFITVSSLVVKCVTDQRDKRDRQKAERLRMRNDAALEIKQRALLAKDVISAAKDTNAGMETRRRCFAEAHLIMKNGDISSGGCDAKDIDILVELIDPAEKKTVMKEVADILKQDEKISKIPQDEWDEQKFKKSVDEANQSLNIMTRLLEQQLTKVE